MKQQKRYKLFNKGFTLIELLVAILIIGILAAIALPQYQKSVERSKAAQALTMLKEVRNAINIYVLANGKYPNSFNDLDISLPASFNGRKSFVNSTGFAVSNEDWSLQLEKSGPYVTLFMGRISGKYKGAGFTSNFTASNNVKETTQFKCLERTYASLYIFDKNLPEGAYCQGIIQAKYSYEDVWGRNYKI